MVTRTILHVCSEEHACRRRNEALGLLLPSEMLETYEGPSVNRFTDEEESSRVNCRATYSDFKRFQTSGRVITPK